MPLLKDLAMKPFLKRMVHRMDFTPFIQEAQHRHLFAAEICTGVCTESHESPGFARIRSDQNSRSSP